MNINDFPLTDLIFTDKKNYDDAVFMGRAIEKLGTSALAYIGASLQDNSDFMLEVLAKIGAPGLAAASVNLKQSDAFIEKAFAILGRAASHTGADNKNNQWQQTAHNIVQFTQNSIFHENQWIAQQNRSPEKAYLQKVQSFTQHRNYLAKLSAKSTENEPLGKALETLMKNHFSADVYLSFQRYLNTLESPAKKEQLIQNAIVAILSWEQELSEDEFAWLKQQNPFGLIFQNTLAAKFAPELAVTVSEIAKDPLLRVCFENIQFNDPKWQPLKIPMIYIGGPFSYINCSPLINKLNQENFKDTFYYLQGFIKLQKDLSLSSDEKIQVIQDLAEGNLALNIHTFSKIFNLDPALVGKLKTLLQQGTQNIFNVLLEHTHQVQFFIEQRISIRRNLSLNRYSDNVLYTSLRELVTQHLSEEAWKSFEHAINQMTNPEAKQELIIDAYLTIVNWTNELSPQELDWMKQHNIFSTLCEDFSLLSLRPALLAEIAHIARNPQLRDRFEKITLKHKALQSLKIPLTLLGDSQNDASWTNLTNAVNQSSLRRASTSVRLDLLKSILNVQANDLLPSQVKVQFIQQLASKDIAAKARTLKLIMNLYTPTALLQLMQSPGLNPSNIIDEFYNFLRNNLKQVLNISEERWNTLSREILDKQRLPYALEIYFAKLQSYNDPKILLSFIQHLQSLLDNTYLSKRYSINHNPHLQKIPQNTLKNWQTNQIQPLEDGYTIHETDNPQDILLCGSEIPHSCLSLNFIPRFNSGLLGYLMHGQVRLIAVKNSEGKIVSRAILRLLLNEQNQPVLFLERIYAAKKGFEDAIHQIAKQKATELGCDLTEYSAQGSYTSSLQSLGGPAPREWIDGIHAFSNDGTFTIPPEHLIRIQSANV